MSIWYTERVDDHAVSHLTGNLCHFRPNRCQHHFRCSVLGVIRRKGWGHQGVLVMLADKLQGLAVIPVSPYGAHGQNQLAHLRRRSTPRHAEALRNVRLNLRAQAHGKTALGICVEVMTDVRQVHWAARKRDGNRAGDF